MVARGRRSSEVLASIASIALLATVSLGCAPAEGAEPSATPDLPSTPPAGTPQSTTAAATEATSPYLDAAVPVADRVEDLLGRMTVEEKVGQITQVEVHSVEVTDVTELGIGSIVNGGNGSPPINTPAGWADMIDRFQRSALESRLGIPILYAVDAVHGFGNVHGATVFPHHIGLGAAGDAELVRRIARATATEMVATGANWNLAPTLAVIDDIRWGRTYEGFGEATGTVTELGAAAVTGLQNVDDAPALEGSTDVVATAKHFIGDGAVQWGTSVEPNSIIDQGDARLDEAELRERLLPPYLAALSAGVRTVMVSFSSWNGERMHGHRYLLTDVLKEELGFDGVVVSDWGGIQQLPGDYDSDVVTSINAGIDMVMVPHDHLSFRSTLLAAIEREAVSMARIDDAVRRILRVKFDAGLFERPFAEPGLLSEVGSQQHRALGREAVGRSAVLLRNEDDTLPLSQPGASVLVAGRAADDIGLQSGGWTIDHQGSAGDITLGSTVLDGVVELASGTVQFEPTGDGDARADVGIVVVAEDPYAEGLGDRADLSLPAADVALIDRVRPRVDRLVVVLLSGRPLVVTEQLAESDAFVAGWLPGSEANGLADVLFGRRPFTGRLPVSWPRTNDQLELGTVWRDAPGCEGPLYPIGYGLGEGSAPPTAPTCP